MLTLDIFKAIPGGMDSYSHILSKIYQIYLNSSTLKKHWATDPDMKYYSCARKLSGRRWGSAGPWVPKRNQYILLRHHPYLRVRSPVTKILSAVKPVCKVSLIRRYTGHRGAGILRWFRGCKEGRYEGSNYELGKPPHTGRDQVTQSTVMQGPKGAAGRWCRPCAVSNTFSGFNILKTNS